MMIAGDRTGADAEIADAQPRAVAQGTVTVTVTVTLSGPALVALGAYLRSGAARGQAFEQPLLDAICGPTAAPTALQGGASCGLSPRLVRRVLDFIEANFARDIRVADIARAANLSPHHLGRGFRHATGQSLWQHVRARRAACARSLIDNRPFTTLAEIAALSGFESYSQFIAAFRKLHGLTPGDYRRRRRGQAQ
jgi:AraC-like DNA-binding protein